MSYFNGLGVVSTDNSTTSTLAGGATFTGDGEQNQFPCLFVQSFSDVAGTLYFDFSNDGTNWDSTFPVAGFSCSAGIPEIHRAVKAGRFFRLRYVNGADAQSSFRLATYFGDFPELSAPLNQSLGSDADATLVRVFPPMVDLVLGNLGGVTEKDKFGFASGLGTSIQLGNPSTWVDIWAYGGQRTAPTTTFTPYMASSSSSDTDIDITWPYLDANGVEQEVTVATDGSDGQTPVSLGVTAQDISRGWNDDSTDLVGNVAVAIANNFTSGEPDTQSEVLAQIAVNDGQTQVLAFRVPAGKQAIVQSIDLELARANGSAGAADVVLQTRENGKVWRTRRTYELTTSGSAERNLNILLPALTDVRARIRDVSDSNSAISGAINYLEVDA